MKLGLPVEPPCCTLGSTQPPFLTTAQEAKGPSLIGTWGSVPVACASDRTAGSRLPCAPVNPVHSLAPLVYVKMAASSYGVSAPWMASSERFTVAITLEGSVWSITKATESGAGSTLKTRSGSRTLFSKIWKSRQVRPATGLPFVSFTVTGTST